MKTSEGKVIKLAVMGGTFDPVHYGHLVAAEAVRAEFKLDKVIFMPTGTPPHKKDRAITGAEHRFRMTVLAAESNPFFEVSRLEIDRGGMSYTIDTVSALLKLYGSGSEVFFITGADAVMDMLSWHRVEELFGLCSFVAATRPGYGNSKLEQRLEQIETGYGKKIHMLEIPSLAISSTDIRSRVKNGKSIKYLLPEPVEKYILENGLYLE